jgi:Domain of unknown function (DUF5666)
MKRIIGIITLVLLGVTLLFAHGDEKHVMGTITKATDSSVTVKDMHGKSVDVAITSTTTLIKNGKAVTAKDIQEGDRVVVHAKQNGNKLEATTVKVGATNMKDMKGMDMHGDKKDMNTSPK